MEIFYREVEAKRKGQTDQEFKQKKTTFDLNKKYNTDMFSTAVRGSKGFAAKQKIRELKKRIIRLKALEKTTSIQISLFEII